MGGIVLEISHLLLGDPFDGRAFRFGRRGIASGLPGIASGVRGIASEIGI